MTPLLITDVAPRDGLQNQPTDLPTPDKAWLVQALADCGLPRIEATSFVSPQAVPRMADAPALMAAVAPLAASHLCVLTPNLKGLARAAQAGAREVCVVLSATETMNRRNIRMGLDEAEATCRQVLAQARDMGLRTRAYVAVAFACPYEGPTPPEVTLRLAQRMAEGGADEVVIADTIGAAHPGEVQTLARIAVEELGPQRVGIHLHDTRGLGLANAWAAIQAGVRRFDSSAGGVGGCPFAPGAAGNLATEDLVWLAQASGYETGVDLPALMRVIDEFGRRLGQPLGGRSHAWLRRHLGLAQSEKESGNASMKVTVNETGSAK